MNENKDLSQGNDAPRPAPSRADRILLILRGLFYPLLYTSVTSAVLLVYRAVTAALVMAGNMGANVAAPDPDSSAGENVVLIVSAALTFAVILIITKVRKKPLKEELHFKAIDPLAGVLAFITGVSLNFSVLFVINFLLPPSVLQSYGENVNYTGSVVIYVLMAMICAPVIEELTYRNFTLVRFKSAMPAWLAAALSAALFGLMHGDTVQKIYGVLFGVLAAAVFIRTDSVFTSILIHSGFNSASVIGIVLGKIGMSEAAAAVVNLVYIVVMYVSVAVSILSVVGLFLLTSKKRKKDAPSAPADGINGEIV